MYVIDRGDTPVKCEDCIYRKFDVYHEGRLFSGAEDSACVKFMRKQDHILRHGEPCNCYKKQEDSEELIWKDNSLGQWWYEPLRKESVEMRRSIEERRASDSRE